MIKIIPSLYRKAIALLQLLVMLMLAVPVWFDEVSAGTDGAVVVMAAGEHNADDACPCCPDECPDDTTGADTCSTCSYCSLHVPLNQPVPSPRYAPAVDLLRPFEQFTRLPEVHLEIFIPPQISA